MPLCVVSHVKFLKNLFAPLNDLPCVGMCCNNMWFYIYMSHCEWAVCGYEGFLVLFSLLYVGLVRFIIRLKYIPVAAGRWSSPVGR